MLENNWIQENSDYTQYIIENSSTEQLNKTEPCEISQQLPNTAWRNSFNSEQRRFCDFKKHADLDYDFADAVIRGNFERITNGIDVTNYHEAPFYAYSAFRSVGCRLHSTYFRLLGV